MFPQHEIRSKRYPELGFSFYLSKRKKNFHMGLEIPLMNYTNCLGTVSDTEDIWREKKTNDT